MILCTSVVLVLSSPFSFLILLVWAPTLFFLMSLAIDFVYLFSEPAFSFTNLSSCFLSLYFIYLFLLWSGSFLSFYWLWVLYVLISLVPLFFIFKKIFLEYSWFTMLYLIQVYNMVSQLTHIHISSLKILFSYRPLQCIE